MADKDALGEFEHQVLLAALRLEDGAFTAAIVLELEQRTQRRVAPAAVYIALRRLEEGGLVKSQKRSGTERGGSRERRYFAVTRRGVTLLKQARGRLFRLWEGLEPKLGER